VVTLEGSGLLSSVTKLSKVLEINNEAMTWLEEQSYSEHLHLLHLVNVKQYILN
jgi:hypothetical protein